MSGSAYAALLPYRQRILLLLKELSKEKLVIVVSHDAEFAHTFGDRILEIADGAIVRDDAA